MSFRYRLPGRDFEERGQTRASSGLNVPNEAVNLLKIRLIVFLKTLKAVNLLKTHGLFDVKPSTH
jgi:hypothetical protein